MILIDSRVGSKELYPLIKQIGAPCELCQLEYGDVAFDGNGPHGSIAIGIERKTLHDMLQCIDDSRYAAHQRPGMLMLYSKSFLCLEGLWNPGNGNGFDGMLMEGFRNGQSWGPLRTRGNRMVLYSKLYRYMMSVALSGVIVTQSTNIFQTAYNIVEMYEYFKKPWSKHTSLVEVQKLAIPDMTGKPSLTRRWASEITDVGVTISQEAERKFKTPVALANSDESDWMTLPGIGAPTARKIVKEIRGWK